MAFSQERGLAQFSCATSDCLAFSRPGSARVHTQSRTSRRTPRRPDTPARTKTHRGFALDALEPRTRRRATATASESSRVETVAVVGFNPIARTGRGSRAGDTRERDAFEPSRATETARRRVEGTRPGRSSANPRRRPTDYAVYVAKITTPSAHVSRHGDARDSPGRRLRAGCQVRARESARRTRRDDPSRAYPRQRPGFRTPRGVPRPRAPGRTA